MQNLMHRFVWKFDVQESSCNASQLFEASLESWNDITFGKRWIQL